jgi:acetyl esterase
MPARGPSERCTEVSAIAVAADIVAALDPERLRSGFGLAGYGVGDAVALLRGPPRALPPPPAGLAIEDDAIDGDPAVPIRIYRPTAGAIPGVVLNVHGGGWVAGSIDGDDARCRTIAEMTGCTVVSVGYRLAPEHPFPAGLDDCAAAIEWCCREAERLGAPTGKLAVIGASAGGNIAVAAMLKLAAAGSACRPAFHIQFYPICDCAMDTPSYAENGTGYFLTAPDMAWYWREYMAGADAATPLASILRSPDLATLPPGLIVTSEYDPLRDEGEALAARINQAGVATECLRYEGAIHGILTLAPQSALSARALEKVATSLAKAFA